MLNPERIRVYFEPVTLADILLCARMCPVEVSGLANVSYLADRLIVSGDLIVFDQKCSKGGTKFDNVAHHRWVNECQTAGREEDIKKARLWWHSHVWSDVYFSSTDEDNIENKLGGGIDKWWLSLVVNKKMEVSLRLDVFAPRPIKPILFGNNFGFTRDISFSDLIKIMNERKNKISEIIKHKVTIVKEKNERR